jgi:hypothetical protein
MPHPQMAAQLTYFFSSSLATGYAAGSVLAVVLAYLIAGRAMKSSRTIALRRLMQLLIVTLLLAAGVCVYASYGSTVFQYYVDTKKAPV